MDIQVDIDNVPSLIRMLNEEEIPYTVAIPDVHACIQIQEAQLAIAGKLFKNALSCSCTVLHYEVITITIFTKSMLALDKNKIK